MTPSKIKFLEGWLQGSDGIALSESSPAKYYYLYHMVLGDPENPLVEAVAEPPTPRCKCRRPRGHYVRVYLAPREMLAVCRKCKSGLLVPALHDPRQWKVTWDDPRGRGEGASLSKNRVGQGVCGGCQKMRMLYGDPNGSVARCMKCLGSQKIH